jgi:23S rRNA pseudouridine955/2504/2580 synthase
MDLIGKNIPVLYEDEACLVLDKPAGLPVQGGQGVGASLDKLLLGYNPELRLVHRLDKDTSGVLLVAKGAANAARLTSLIAGHAAGGVHKIYQAITRGLLPAQSGEIRTEMNIRGKGKSAVTYYRVQKSWKTEAAPAASYSLLELELGTGRIHQIRRHLAQSGCPILGDDKYGDFALNKALHKSTGLKRLLLHASRLSIPALGIDVSSGLPDYFEQFLLSISV